jgi:hypothetical protein
MEHDDLLTIFLFDRSRGVALGKTLSQEQWQECLEAAVRHKILPLVASYYHCVSTQPLTPNLEDILVAHRCERNSWLEACRALQFGSDETQAMLMKGFGHELLYPECIERFAKDLDIVVRDLPAFCNFATQLFLSGFSLPFMARFYLHPDTGEWCGIARFIFEQGLEDGGVELHIGQFAVDHSHLIDWAELEPHAVKRQLSGIPLCVPDIGMMLKVFFMELATRPECMLRDLYDGHCLFIAATLSPQALYDELAEAQLLPQVDKLLAGFQLYRQPPPPLLKFLAQNIHGSDRTIPLPWRQRVRQAIDRTAEKGGWWLNVLSLLDRPSAIKFALRRGMAVNALLIDARCEAIGLRRYKKYLMLTTPAGTFLLGICGLFSDDEVEQLQAYLARGALPPRMTLEEKQDG